MTSLKKSLAAVMIAAFAGNAFAGARPLPKPTPATVGKHVHKKLTASQMGQTNDGNSNKFPALKKGLTTFLNLNDSSNHTSDAFAATTSIIMVVIWSSTSKGVYANIGTNPSTSSAITTVMYLPTGTYYFAVNPGEVFRAHQEDGASIITVIQGLDQGPTTS